MRTRSLLIVLCFGPAVAGCRTTAPAEGPAPVVVSANPPPPDAPAASSERIATPPSPDLVDLEAGRQVFKRNCTPCHGAHGQGLIGPNLTDRCFEHGHRRMDIKRVIVEGVPDKGMVAWKPLLSDDEIENVTGYVESVGGQNVPGKPCDGVRVDAVP